MLEISGERAMANRILKSKRARSFASALASAVLVIGPAHAQVPSFDTFAVASGSAPHDVAPAPDYAVWNTAQASMGVLTARHCRPANGGLPHLPTGGVGIIHGKTYACNMAITPITAAPAIE
jgi:virginiamycin B lyase